MPYVPQLGSNLDLLKILHVAGAVSVAVFAMLFAMVGRPVAMGIELLYLVVTLGSLAWLHIRGTGVRAVATFHVVAVLVVTLAITTRLGGIVGSGGFVAWSLISPLAAMIFLQHRGRIAAFVAFVGTMLLSAAPLPLPAEPLPDVLRSSFFVANVVGSAVLVFVTLAYFLGRLSAEQRERDRAMREREEMETRLRQAQKLESLGVLAGGIAHDFNNLLVGILGRADLALAQMPEDAAGRLDVESIEVAGRRAARLCDQLLAYSGRGRFEVEALDLEGIVAEVAQLLEVTVARSAELRYEFAGDLPAVQGDATQVRQVLMNLLTNASEALDDQPGTITMRTGTRTCSREDLLQTWYAAGEAGEYVFVEVQDTGCGMDDGTLARLFEPFFTTKFAGRGLGMAAVLGIVRAHLGAIEVSSAPGQGSRFCVLLPASEEDAASDHTLQIPARQRSGRAGTVLLVDDEELVLQTVGEMLADAGYDVLTAVNGLEAVELFDARTDDVACVVLDMTMPTMGGEQAFHLLRDARADVPVVLSSGYSEHEFPQRFAGHARVAFLHKPYRSDTLLQRIDEAREGPDASDMADER